MPIHIYRSSNILVAEHDLHGFHRNPRVEHTAMLAGFACRDLAQDVLNGSLGLEEAAVCYSHFAAAERRRFRALVWANIGLLLLPRPLVGIAARLLGQPSPLGFFMRQYIGIFRQPSLLDTVPASSSSAS